MIPGEVLPLISNNRRIKILSSQTMKICSLENLRIKTHPFGYSGGGRSETHRF